ncbi:Sec-independent protein translocase subunit TatA/TatB [Youngiibacter multivorans]|uniref:Sec-independent protein translocase protein TatA n=1 Tax=Youngiibacter multivorans TaxID=937251 RepID=A0ABS4G7R9_9CLOT|nr:twin-arginine translocase TatA/TatE family subunit [Youngiibacter multivorans]MBP1920588.1 Sec-independent protein translocase protein TatA [Youngiibacter multivorans]
MKIGTTEFIVILIVALLALGPEKMPMYAKKLGKAISMIKELSGKITEEIKENVTDPLAEAVEPLTSLKKDISASLQMSLDTEKSSGEKSIDPEADPKDNVEGEYAAL